MPKDPNDVGAVWKKFNERGTKWLSLNLNLERLLELTGGDTGTVKLVAFERKKFEDKQPDYQLLYPRQRAASAPEADPDVPHSMRPNTPGVRDVDYGEIAGTASYRRRPRDDR